MKFFVAIAVFCSVLFVVRADPPTLSQELIDTLTGYKNQCLQEQGITLTQAQENELWSFDYSNSCQELKCLILCIFKKIGTFDANGDIAETYIMNRLTPIVGYETADGLRQECNPLSTSGNTKCDAAVNIFECYMTAGVPIIV